MTMLLTSSNPGSCQNFTRQNKRTASMIGPPFVGCVIHHAALRSAVCQVGRSGCNFSSEVDSYRPTSLGSLAEKRKSKSADDVGKTESKLVKAIGARAAIRSRSAYHSALS